MSRARRGHRRNCLECKRSWVGDRVLCSVKCRDAYEVRKALARNKPPCEQCGYRGLKELRFIKVGECGIVPGLFCSRACWELARGKLEAERQRSGSR